MRLKKKLLFLSACFFIFTYVILYLLSNKSISNEDHSYPEKLKSNKFQNFSLMKKSPVEKIKTCNAIGGTTLSDIQMFNLYQELKFNNLDGGVWKQGWNVKVNKERWSSENKLKVFVVPHSHNDPGWIKTFEQYYKTQTKYIFNNMITKLQEDNRRKFIWAEISYLSLWWDDVSEIQRNKFKQLVNNGQIEIVSGGWVMPDEANSHYYSLIQELTHGHQWLKKHLKIQPKRSWCIDPFGVSPTMPFLLQNFNLESLVIQRTHYAIKKYLAETKQLEFRWRQSWDAPGKYDFLTHMMPFYSYDIPHTCGPDPSICCQFDFRRNSKFGMACPWKKPPQLITDKNVAFRAALLLDQYRKKAELYSTNVLLIPLGDDFRYDIAAEWDLQYENYQKLFNYMNNNPSLHVEAQFGTLTDYFEALTDEKPELEFPTLQGDFFTYSDVDNHYWSGYYTSRPYYKRMDRELIAYLRSAEILHAIAWKTDTKYSLPLISTEFIDLLRKARSSLSLFQHHDGITGTARNHVVGDYAQKLDEAMRAVKHVMQQSLYYILHLDKNLYQVEPREIYFDLRDNRKTPTSEPTVKVYSISSLEPIQRVVVFNSLSWHRVEILNIRINNYKNVEVCDENNQVVPHQISPYCEINDHSGNCYLLYFEVNIKPLEIQTFYIKFIDNIIIKDKMASLKIINGAEITTELQFFQEFLVGHLPASEFFIQNDKLSVTFRPDGLIKAVTLKENDLTVPVHLNFVKYTCQRGRVMCGAYLFLPEGESRIIECVKPLIKIIEGRLVSTVIVYCDFVIHAVNIYNTKGYEAYNVEIQNLVDIRNENNFEIAMKLSTNIKNEGIFYTDLNGFQITKRSFLKKLPLQANYYPMPSSIFIEDDNARVSVLSAQPLGASSLDEGAIEIMQDRRLSQDDERGLGQGVLDNRPILHIFKLVVEKKIANCQKNSESHLAGYLSVISYLALNSILYPIMLFVYTGVETSRSKFLNSYNIEGLNNSASIDIHIVTMTTLPEEKAVGFVLHRVEMDTCFYQEYELYSFSNGVVNLTSFVPLNENEMIRLSSLSFTNVHNTYLTNNLYEICPMDLTAFYVSEKV